MVLCISRHRNRIAFCRRKMRAPVQSLTICIPASEKIETGPRFKSTYRLSSDVIIQIISSNRLLGPSRHGNLWRFRQVFVEVTIEQQKTNSLRLKPLVMCHVNVTDSFDIVRLTIRCLITSWVNFHPQVKFSKSGKIHAKLQCRKPCSYMTDIFPFCI
jgi:hypothetical protein